MSFQYTVQSLSALAPIKFNYNNSELLNYTVEGYSNLLKYNKYAAFNNIKDATLSKKNLLFLTDTVSLSSIFKNPIKDIILGQLAGTFYLQNSKSQFIQIKSNTELFVGDRKYPNLSINIVPLNGNIVELHVGNNTKLEVSSTYPFGIYPSNNILTENEKHRQQFEIEYSNNLISFKVKTAHGWRYLSYSARDGIVRAVGVMLNDSIVNSYLFTPVFITKDSLSIGFNPYSSEVKYFNKINTAENKLNLEIQEEQISETNLLITCSTSDALKLEEVDTNIALLRTNFTSTGCYSPSQQ